MAIEDLLVSYCTAVDSLHDIDAICAVFTEDAEFDLSGIGMPSKQGHSGIREFFNAVFASMTHHAHYLTNFTLTSFEGNRASARAYIIGIGRGKDGTSVTVNGRYYFDVVRTPEGWKAKRYTMDFLLPLDGTLADVPA